MTAYPRTITRAFSACISARRDWLFCRDASASAINLAGAGSDAARAAMAAESSAHDTMMTEAQHLTHAIYEAGMGELLPEFARCLRASADGKNVAYILPGDKPCLPAYVPAGGEAL